MGPSVAVVHMMDKFSSIVVMTLKLTVPLTNKKSNKFFPVKQFISTDHLSPFQLDSTFYCYLQYDAGKYNLNHRHIDVAHTVLFYTCVQYYMQMNMTNKTHSRIPKYFVHDQVKKSPGYELAAFPYYAMSGANLALYFKSFQI
jgi:hypothetical protein